MYGNRRNFLVYIGVPFVPASSFSFNDAFTALNFLAGILLGKPEWIAE